VAADDEERGCTDASEVALCEIWPSSTRDNGSNDVRSNRRSNQRGRGAGTGSETTNRKRPEVVSLPDPLDRCHDATAEPRDIESEPSSLQIDRLFVWREQVQQQCAESPVLQELSHCTISPAEAAAAAAVCEDDETRRFRWNVKVRSEVSFGDVNPD